MKYISLQPLGNQQLVLFVSVHIKDTVKLFDFLHWLVYRRMITQ